MLAQNSWCAHSAASRPVTCPGQAGSKGTIGNKPGFWSRSSVSCVGISASRPQALRTPSSGPCAHPSSGLCGHPAQGPADTPARGSADTPARGPALTQPPCSKRILRLHFRTASPLVTTPHVLKKNTFKGSFKHHLANPFIHRICKRILKSNAAKTVD